MSRNEKIRKASTATIRSFADFRERFLPEGDSETDILRKPEDIGERLAKESLHRLQSVLSSVTRKIA
jgi:hypothetical protein